MIGKTRATVLSNARKLLARVFLKVKNAAEIKIRMGQNVTAIGWPILQWVKVSRYDKWFIF
jgi:hypothetical protein